MEFILGIKHSASMMIYIDAIDQMDTWSKIVYFFIAKIALNCFIWPKPILLFFLYFTTDVGTDAFELPIPMWYGAI